MVLFFFGEDTFRIKQKVKQMKEKYISASLGDTNLAVLDGKTTLADDIIRQALAYPFLAKSRLVIVENLLLSQKKSVTDEPAGKTVSVAEKIGDFLPKVPETTILVFTENGLPDKRTSLFKKLNKGKMVQEFKSLDEAGVKSWLRSELAQKGGQIEPDAVDKLFEYVGADLWRMSNEIEKLTTYNSCVTSKNIELLVRSKTSSDIFAMIDALAQKNKKQAMAELYRLVENGEHELYVLSMIIYQYRNLVVVRDLVERGVTNQWDIAKKASLHPFVAQKTLNLARNYSFGQLKNIYNELLENDIKIKTGQIDPATALDLLVHKLTSSK